MPVKRYFVCFLIFCLMMTAPALAADIDYTKVSVQLVKVPDVPIPGYVIYLEDEDYLAENRYLVPNQYGAPYIYDAAAQTQIDLTANESDTELWLALDDGGEYQAACEQSGVIEACFRHVGGAAGYVQHQQKGDYVLLEARKFSFLIDLQNNEIRPAVNAFRLLDNGRYLRRMRWADEFGYEICEPDGTVVETVDLSGIRPEDPFSAKLTVQDDSVAGLFITGKYDHKNRTPIRHCVVWREADGSASAQIDLGNYVFPEGPDSLLLLNGNAAIAYNTSLPLINLFVRRDGVLALQWDGSAMTAVPLEEIMAEDGTVPMGEKYFYPIGASANGEYAALWVEEGILMMNVETLETNMILSQSDLDAVGMDMYALGAACWNGGEYLGGGIQYLARIIR